MILHFGLLLLNFVWHLLATEHNYDPPIVQAILGHPAEIPCNVSNLLSEDEASLILWYRLPLPNPIYTLDVRNGGVNGTRHFPIAEMENRTYFNVSVHPPVLAINSVSIHDEGDYKCRVDLKRSRTLILITRLDVIVPPGVPIIKDEHGQHLHDLIGPYDEGSSLNFICEVDGGDPIPEVTWWRGTTLIDDSFNISKQGFVRNEIFLNTIQRGDWMAEYSCKASNTDLIDPLSASLQLDMNLFPLELKIIMPNLPIQAGEQQDIVCETRGSRPKAITTWWLEGENVGDGSLESHTDDGNVTLSILRFTPKPEDDGKLLTCKSANPVLPKSTLETHMRLRVQYLPILNLILGPIANEYGVKEGTDTYLECNISSNPEVHNVTWEFEGRSVSSNIAFGMVILNQTLLLQKIRKDHQGQYRCQAHNEIGKGYSNLLDLPVQFAPVCKSSATTFFGISTSESVNLTCDVEGNPSDIIFQWSFNSTLETDSRILEVNSSIFQYSPRTEDGYGVLMCWGRNSVGTQQEPCVFKVIPAGAPEPLSECVVSNRTSYSLSVECRAGYNGSLTQLFHMEIYNSVAEYMADNLTRTDRPSFEADGLSPSTSYVLVIYSSNAKGRSKSLALVATTLSPAKRRTAREVPAPLNPVLVTIIAAMVLLVIASILAIIIIKSRTTRQISKKDNLTADGKNQCEMEKKELEESQDATGKGPDIIPLSKDPEVFHLEGYLEDVHPTECLQKQDSPPTEYIRLKYMHTVL